VRSFILTKVRDCGLLIVVTFPTFLRRKDMLKKKSSQSKITSRLLAYTYTCVLCTHIRIHICRDVVRLDSSGPSGASSRLLGSQPSTPSVEVDGLARIPGLTQVPYKSFSQPPNSVPRSPSSDLLLKRYTQGSLVPWTTQGNQGERKGEGTTHERFGS